ncbi:MAG: DUF4317 domain-containing protein [Clostridia bacterium]|nr:DUF4317 domain-containing protein [Clostridia bacterium]
MNKKDLASLRRRFAPDKNDISIIRGCFVNEKREIVSTFSKSPVSLPESEAEHYLSAFKKTLGGAPGRNQFSIPVHTDDPAGQLLCQLQSSELTDEKAVNQLFHSIIDGLEIDGSYLILAMHDAYSVPYKETDEHAERPDFSDTIFNYIIVSICPVKLTKPLLTFFRDDRDFHTVEPDLAVGTPSLGFMYPVFDDGGADINSALYYTKDAADIHADFIDAIFQAVAPESGADQRDQFYGVLADTLEDGVTFQVVQSLHESITAQMTDRKPSAAPLQVSRGEIAGLLGASEKEQKAFDEAYLEQFGAVGMAATTVVEPKKFVIETENVTIQVDPSRSDLVEMKRIDGRRYILVAVEGEATVNGVEVNIP